MAAPRDSRRLLLLPLAALLAALGCSRPEPRVNFLLVSVDTLRADHLGSYGYARDTSPHLDAFAEHSVRFAKAFAPAPWTLPSHLAILTGRHPYEMGIVHYESAIPEHVPTLAGALAEAGYQTAAFVDSAPSGLLGEQRGFARGFERFAHAPHVPGSPYKYDMATTVDVGLRWLEARDRDRPFFLFLHTKSVHTTPAEPQLLAESDVPYDKPEPYRSRFLPAGRPIFSWSESPQIAGVIYLRAMNDRIAAGAFDRESFPPAKIEELVGLYDGGIYYFDEHFGRLLEGLEAQGLADDTVVIVTADHGEAFLDYRFFLHKELHEPLLHVPLLIHDPRHPEPRVVWDRVALADIAPTVFALAGLAAPEGLSGRALPLRAGEGGAPRPFYSYFNWEDDYFYRAFALHEGPWKLVYHKVQSWPDYRVELFNTDADPEERRPLAGETERERAMLGRLLEWVESEPEAGAQRIELDAEAIENLRALGYLE